MTTAEGEPRMVAPLAVPAALEELVRPHIDSFDYFISEGLERVLQELQPVEVRAKANSAAVCLAQLACIVMPVRFETELGLRTTTQIANICPHCSAVMVCTLVISPRN